jgi:hypothetical protein
LTQAELDIIRIGLIAGCLQLAISIAIAKMNNEFEHAAMLEACRVKMDAIAERIGNGELRGVDVGEA